MLTNIVSTKQIVLVKQFYDGGKISLITILLKLRNVKGFTNIGCMVNFFEI